MRRFSILYFIIMAVLSLNAFAAMGAKKHRHVRAQAVPAVERYPEARCEQVRASVLSDLPHFCELEPVDQIRLVDFGSQLDLLEHRCGDKETAAKLRKALGHKAHQHDKAACAAAAGELQAAKAPGARASALPAGAI